VNPAEPTHNLGKGAKPFRRNRQNISLVARVKGSNFTGKLIIHKVLDKKQNSLGSRGPV